MGGKLEQQISIRIMEHSNVLIYYTKLQNSIWKIQSGNTLILFKCNIICILPKNGPSNIGHNDNVVTLS